MLFDSLWRCVYATDDARLIYGGRVELAPFPIGAYYLGPDYVSTALEWGGRQFPLEILRQALAAAGPWMLADALHWGATLYVGQIATSGRTEVTALGDEVNEGGRIEACATDGRALASKALVEGLGPEHAATLGLDPDRLTYTTLADLPTATEKARRDAPAIAVCEV